MKGRQEPQVREQTVAARGPGVKCEVLLGRDGWAAPALERVPCHCYPSLQVINRSTTELPLTVSYDKISLGRLRFWIHMQDAVYSLQQFGEAAGQPGPGEGCDLEFQGRED